MQDIRVGHAETVNKILKWLEQLGGGARQLAAEVSAIRGSGRAQAPHSP